MGTAQSLILGLAPVVHEAPPPTPKAPLALELDADHIAALHAQATRLHNIRSLVYLLLDIVAPPSLSGYLMDNVVLSWLHITITVELQYIIHD
jgi:hypothetical protein